MKRRPEPLAKFAEDFLPSEFVQPLNVQWINGKPIYRQTFDISGLTGGESQTLLSEFFVDQMIRIYGLVNNNAGAFVGFPYGTLADADYAILFSGNNNLFSIETSAATLPGSILVCEFTQGAGEGGGGG